ncbi:MAG: iron-siderophore ABC transporter substrate-binding protein [Cyanobacteria bacterium P01_H01_bin.162]
MAIRWLIGWFIVGILSFSLLTSCANNRGEVGSPLEQAVGECRIVQHKLGETCVPDEPQRIATLSLYTLAHAISLGVKPIGSTHIDDWYYAPYLEGKLDGIELLGNENVNLEKLLLLKPDVIIGLDWDEAAYPTLSEIAPTVLDDWGGTENWRIHLELVAEVLEKQKAAEQAWADYYQRIKELNKALGNRYDGRTISLIFVDSEGMYSEVKGSFSDSILKDIGLQRPAAQDVIAPYSHLRFTEETLEIADGDFLFIGGLTAEDKERVQEFIKEPLWQKLRAVQEGHVYTIDHMTWWGSNLIAADLVIDDLFKYLVNADDT